MTYSLNFSLAAQNDVIDSIHWYNNEKENLGFEFYLYVDQKIKLLAKNPLHFSIRFNHIRASKVTRYPYLIYFKIDEKRSSIIILGVLHTSRNPNIIKNRK